MKTIKICQPCSISAAMHSCLMHTISQSKDLEEVIWNPPAADTDYIQQILPKVRHVGFQYQLLNSSVPLFCLLRQGLCTTNQPGACYVEQTSLIESYLPLPPECGINRLFSHTQTNVLLKIDLEMKNARKIITSVAPTSYNHL